MEEKKECSSAVCVCTHHLFASLFPFVLKVLIHQVSINFTYLEERTVFPKSNHVMCLAAPVLCIQFNNMIPRCTPAAVQTILITIIITINKNDSQIENEKEQKSGPKKNKLLLITPKALLFYIVYIITQQHVCVQCVVGRI